LIRLDERLEKLNKRVAENPQNIESWLTLAQANYYRGNYLEAISAYEQITNIDPQLWETQLGIAQILEEIKQYQNALQILNKYAVEHPNEVFGYLLFLKFQNNPEIKEGLGELSALYKKFSPAKENIDLAIKSTGNNLPIIEEFIEDLQTLENPSILDKFLKTTAEAQKEQLNEDLKKLKELEKKAKPMTGGELSQLSSQMETVAQELNASPLEQEIKELLNAKGIILAVILDRKGAIKAQFVKEDSFEGNLQQIFKDAGEVLQNIQTINNLHYWLLEYDHGLLVIYNLNQDWFLICQGMLGTNFGALRYMIEQKKQTLCSLLPGGGS